MGDVQQHAHQQAAAVPVRAPLAAGRYGGPGACITAFVNCAVPAVHGIGMDVHTHDTTHGFPFAPGRRRTTMDFDS